MDTVPALPVIKDVRGPATHAGLSEFAAEDLQLLLSEADRALMIIDGRNDEPGRRTVDGVAPEDAGSGKMFNELTLAMAELVDAYPGLLVDIERVSDRIRSAGATAGAAELARYRPLVDLVRLSLEALFTVCSDIDAFDGWRMYGDDEELYTAGETFAAYATLLDLLRSNLN